jgi:crossover junction endodeoxyribonuclease RuvC
MLDEDGEIKEKNTFKFNQKELDTEGRLQKVKNELIDPIINLHHGEPIKVCIEGPSFHSKGRYVLQMGALNFFIRYFMREEEVDYKVLTPSELKKYVTGKGNSGKELILLHVFKKWGVEFKSNDLADAYGLARYILEEDTNA